MAHHSYLGWNANPLLAADLSNDNIQSYLDFQQSQQLLEPYSMMSHSSTSYAGIQNGPLPATAHASYTPGAKTKACDSCRLRKIKCLRLDVEGIEPGSETCLPCRGVGSICKLQSSNLWSDLGSKLSLSFSSIGTYAYVPKRPGPQSRYVILSCSFLSCYHISQFDYHTAASRKDRRHPEMTPTEHQRRAKQ